MTLVAYNAVSLLLLFATLPLTLELLVLSISALIPIRAPKTRAPAAFRLAVVIPAHNEERLITTCINSLRADRTTPFEVFVVAHNCTDQTAELASAAGARVLPLVGLGGKGLALDHGFRKALELGADAVLVVDADSVVSKNLLAAVSGSIRAGASAVQARYEVANPDENQRTRLSALSIFGMNVVRPRGRANLGLSCGMFGNGFALAADTLHLVPYTANSLVEDLEYHLRLLNAGTKVNFLDHACVFGEMPKASPAASTQRARWEGGRVQLRRTLALPMLNKVLGGELGLLEPLLDLLCLPLATQLPLLFLACIMPVRWARIYGGVGLLGAVFYVVVCFILTIDKKSSLRALAAVPGYILWKALMLSKTAFASRQGAAWVRTDRN